MYFPIISWASLGAFVFLGVASKPVDIVPGLDPNRNCQIKVHQYLHNLVDENDPIEKFDKYALTVATSFPNGTQIDIATEQSLQPFGDSIHDQIGGGFSSSGNLDDDVSMEIGIRNSSSVVFTYGGDSDNPIEFFNTQQTGTLKAHCPLNTEFMHCDETQDCNATETKTGETKIPDPKAVAERDIHCIFPC
ncbi:Uu.00g086310.m01.CDS01 [Anthostomella pinea]|uniref:Uu.00g086310.m01.CDS01 n=1 Tax=Anthostomella pinea TaxID=933095 RepID=A0AAI8VM42_9PEZI|nr:Uu.00g086310.m01.CDS01 [Anthostomella pinea]